MALSDVNVVAWLLRPPAAALARESLTHIRPLPAALGVLSAAFSMALSETIILSESPSRLAFNTVSLTFGLSLTVALFFELSRAAGKDQADWREWITAGAFALAPLHLTLPFALLGVGFGTSGVIFYELSKLFLLVTVAKRWLLTVRMLNSWPAWAATLLLLAPAILGLIGMGFLMLSLFGAFLLILAGAAG
jgi:hypothetical protein